VADGGAVVEKSVFGILQETRQLWAQLLCGQLPLPAAAVSDGQDRAHAAASPHRDGSTAAAAQQHSETLSNDEAQAFISQVILPCINLMHVNDARELMTRALDCVEAWLKVRSSLPWAFCI
jgi:hypothetical protein